MNSFRHARLSMAAAALLTLGGAADAPAFNARAPYAAPPSYVRPRDLRDKKRKKPVKKKVAVKRRSLFRARAVPLDQTDTRHDKYLHSHARQMRRLKWALEHSGQHHKFAPYPFDADDYEDPNKGLRAP